MNMLFACGINHRTAPLSLREQFVFTHNDLTDALGHLLHHAMVNEAAILSTCNRTEIYCHAPQPDRIMQWLSSAKALPYQQLEKHLYCHQHNHAVEHVMRVASGLDSMVLGESQILAQMKQSLCIAKKVGALGNRLQRLFQYSFSASKHIRTHTAIGTYSVSVPAIAVTLAKRIFSNLHERQALLIGAGDMIEQAAHHLSEQGVKRFIIANRTFTKATLLSHRYPNAIPLELRNLPDVLPQADMIVSATSSPLPILGKGAIESALKKRKYRPMLLLDLAVPRDIESETAQLNNVYLYTIDDLQTISDNHLKKRQHAAQQATSIIEKETAHFMEWYRTLPTTPIVCAYRETAHEIRDRELNKQLKALELGNDPKTVLQQLAYQLTNKLVHAPTIHIKEHADDSETLSLARQLFELE